MAKEKFRVVVDRKPSKEWMNYSHQFDNLGASRFEILEATLTAFIHLESKYANQVWGIFIRNL